MAIRILFIGSGNIVVNQIREMRQSDMLEIDLLRNSNIMFGDEGDRNHTTNSWEEVVKLSSSRGQYDYLILAVKPQVFLSSDFQEMFKELLEHDILSQNNIVISVMASVSREIIAQNILLDTDVDSIIRIIPNIQNQFVCLSSKNYDQSSSILTYWGDAFYVKMENQLDVLAPIIGSAPAYFFKILYVKFIEYLISLDNLGNTSSLKQLFYNIESALNEYLESKNSEDAEVVKLKEKKIDLLIETINHSSGLIGEIISGQIIDLQQGYKFILEEVKKYFLKDIINYISEYNGRFGFSLEQINNIGVFLEKCFDRCLLLVLNCNDSSTVNVLETLVFLHKKIDSVRSARGITNKILIQYETDIMTYLQSDEEVSDEYLRGFWNRYFLVFNN